MPCLHKALPLAVINKALVDQMKFYCTNCGKYLAYSLSELEDNTRPNCPNCGTNEITISLHLEDNVEVLDDVKLEKSTKKPTGGKKVLMTEKNGWELHHDTQTWQKRIRIADKEKDIYYEKIENVISGFKKKIKEKLSEHRNAKNKK